ncbi:tetratricopeptide repeat protein [Pleurocapsales cyanobacterium LEGE 06147]|nr:tetratricopeptide repeat protein [Pleurocapsales cyanobacterium LEGE 06147]
MPNSGNDRPNSGARQRTSGRRSPHPGQIIGERYQIIRELGRGGFGKTYLARDIEVPGKPKCVIKQLQPRSNRPEVWRDAKERFNQEAIVQQRLGNHDQIPRLLSYFEENQEFYLVQEFIEGEELQREVAHQPLSETQVIALLQDVLRILDFVHKTNVIHRDIKPSNLIRRQKDGKFVLIDFGAVKEITTLALDAQGQVFTQTIGTQGFMPPEQIAGKPVWSSDIYALGQTAIYALTGRSPLEFEEAEEDTLPNWQDFNRISPELAAIVKKMISPKCTERYRSAIEVLQDLQPLQKIDQVLGGRYRIKRYLGGTAGIYTYLAENLRRHYQSPCVIKEIKLHYSDPLILQTAERRFANELTVIERLSYHAQIPQLWDHFEENEAFYLVEEYVAGESWAQKLQRDRLLEEQQVINLLKSALEVLAFIHQHRVVHRDINPSNLIVRSSDDKVVLVNFGVLKEIAQLPIAGVDSNQPVGTEAYMPPEQIAGRATFSSDIYALGLTAIEALTGTRADSFKTNQKTGEILWREGVRVNRRLAKILDKMTNLYVEKRYQSADKALNDLNKITNLPSTLSRVTRDKEAPNEPKNDRIHVSPETKINLNGASIKRENWFKPGYILVAVAGITVLLGSIELFFPTFRPLYYWYQGRQQLTNHPETAIATFDKAIDLQPQNTAAWIGRGDALYRLERFPESLAAYDEAIQLDRNNPRAWRGRGDALYRLERFPAALASFEKALQLQPNNTEVFNRKGRALYKLERYQEAADAQAEALELDPNNAQALSDLGIALIGLGKYQEALDAFNQAQRSEPLDPRFWQNKALALQYLNRPQEATRVYQEALAAYDQVLKDRPQDLFAWLDRGNVLSQLQRHQDALASYEKGIEINSDSHLAWLGKGNALFALGKPDEALAAFDRALEIRPESFITWHNRGSLLRDALGDFSEAIDSYDKAVAINPNFYHAWRDKGFALAQSGQNYQAIESFQRATNLNPNDYQAWVGRGIALSSLNKTDEALAAFERAQEIQPNEPFVWMNKGSALEKWGRYNEACDAYGQVKKLNPTFPPAIQAIERLGCRIN